MPTTFDPNIHAELVYDGGNQVHVPERFGTPASHQLQGTPLEQLAELAGRVCYDSLGAANSRTSFEYHAHIRAVRHGSVYEHCTFTVAFKSRVALEETLLALMNRPGVYVRSVGALRLTVNLRAVLEFGNVGRGGRSVAGAELEKALVDVAHTLAPQVLHGHEVPLDRATLRPGFTLPTATVVAPETDDEKWVSLLMCGSRGMSHELVRHGDWTAISQRSTRYVNEDESPWVEHPLMTYWRWAPDAQMADDVRAVELAGEEPLEQLVVPMGVENALVRKAKTVYARTVLTLEDWLVSRGADKFTARKQARGAARGYLGNALYTELIFSASVAQWRWMLAQRCSDAADAEIRVLFAKALRELQRSRYGDRFADFTLRPAKDGIGEVLV